MDKLDNENMREEVPDVVSPARDPLLVTGTQGSANVDLHAHSWLVQFWERIRYWFRASMFSPEWLTSPWNHPVVGSLFAFLLPMGSIILTLLLRSIFLTFVLQG